MALLTVSSLTKSYGRVPVLNDVSFAVAKGEIVCLLGPSGCGKTTLLRVIAGLEKTDTGQVKLEGRPLEDVPVHRRGFGLMFQDFALFPHKDVLANVVFGLRMESMPRAQIYARAAEMLELVGLAGYEQRRVYDLSGGEQQRVALARSLAPSPRLLMLDEPLGSLDRGLREDLMNELRAILKGVGVTAIYVTHDQEEAFAIADQVILMRTGYIVQQGSPQSVYQYPSTPWIARFLGLTNLIDGTIIAMNPVRVHTALGHLTVSESGQLVVGQQVTVLIRPGAARLAGDHPDDRYSLLRGTVGECSFRGGHYRVAVQFPEGLEMVFELIPEATRLPEPGEPISLGLRPEGITLLPRGSHG